MRSVLTIAGTSLVFLLLAAACVFAFRTGFIDWTLNTTVLCAYLCLGPVTFAAYHWDKRQAVNGGRRIPERTLHLLELLGGFPAAFLAQRLLRHKCRKVRYQLVYFAIVGLHGLFWARTFVMIHLFGIDPT